jgi:hypothetical protein
MSISDRTAASEGERSRARKIVTIPLADRIGISTTVYLLLGIWLGPAPTLLLVIVIAAIVGWLCLCRKHPRIAWAVFGFTEGLICRRR